MIVAQILLIVGFVFGLGALLIAALSRAIDKGNRKWGIK
jgi:hypothetical protein